MKARPTIGIISPGDMGHALGTVLVQHSLRVLTNLQGRSARTVALATQALTAGEALGLSETLTSELRESQAELFAWFERQVPRMPPKAYRWVGEMEEIARTFSDLGLPPQMLEGAAALYRLVERTELGAETPEERHQGQTLAEVVGILADASNGNWR